MPSIICFLEHARHLTPWIDSIALFDADFTTFGRDLFLCGLFLKGSNQVGIYHPIAPCNERAKMSGVGKCYLLFDKE